MIIIIRCEGLFLKQSVLKFFVLIRGRGKISINFGLDKVRYACYHLLLTTKRIEMQNFYSSFQVRANRGEWPR